MRRFVALGAALLLAVSMAAPVVAQGAWIDATITSATVDRGGNVTVYGTAWCSQEMDVDMQGQVSQAIGHKVTIRGGLGGGMHCNFGLPSTFQAGAGADTGMFGPGWATIDIQFGHWVCDPDKGCWWEEYGKISQYLKIVKK